MICPNCGTQNAETAKFCKGCGSALQAAPVAETTYTEQPMQNEMPAEQPTYMEQPMPNAAPVITNEPPVYNAVVTEQPTKDPGKVFGIIALVVGILSLPLSSVCVCTCSCFGPSIGLVLAIVGAILGFIGKKKSKEAGFKNTLALVGMILSIASIVIGLLTIVIIFVVPMLMGTSMSILPAMMSSY